VAVSPAAEVRRCGSAANLSRPDIRWVVSSGGGEEKVVKGRLKAAMGGGLVAWLCETPVKMGG